jgi:parallel beta-helix repeat protein
VSNSQNGTIANNEMGNYFAQSYATYGIYLSSSSPDTVISGNSIRNLTEYRYGNDIIYIGSGNHRTIIQGNYLANFSTTTVYGTSGIRTSGSQYLMILDNVVGDGFHTTGSGAWTGLYMQGGCEYSLVENNTFKNVTQPVTDGYVYGMRIWSPHTVARGNLIYDLLSKGMTYGIDVPIFSGDYRNVTVEGNTIKDLGCYPGSRIAYGISSSTNQKLADLVISGNTIENIYKIDSTEGRGIQVRDAVNSTIFNNTLRNTGQYGISSVVSGDNLTVSHNHVEGAVYYALDMSSAINSVFHHNELYSSGIQHVRTHASNVWNDTQVGNYYDDYEVKYPDAFNDGDVWDTPYLLESTSYDYAPLAQVPQLPGAPEAVDDLDAVACQLGIELTWSAPNDGGSPIVEYNVYRAATESGDYTLLTQVDNPCSHGHSLEQTRGSL